MTDTDLKPAVPDDDDDRYAGLSDVEREGLMELDADEAAMDADRAIEFPEDEPDFEAKAEDDAAQAAREEEAARTAQHRQEAQPPQADMPMADFSKEMEAARNTLRAAHDREKELQDLWDNGEIGKDERDAELAKVRDQIIEAESDLASLKTLNNAQAATQRQQEAARQAQLDRQWNEAQTAFVKRNPDFVSKAHLDAFNRVVSEYTKPDGLYADWDYADVLDKAAQDYLAILSRRGESSLPTFNAAKAVGGDDPKPKMTSEREQQAKLMREPPVTLRDVPSDEADPHQSVAQKYARMIERETDPERVDAIWAELAKNPELEDRVLQYGAA